MNLLERINEQFNDSAQTKLRVLESLAMPIAESIELLARALLDERKIIACGNGSSAAAAQHFTSLLVNRFERQRPPLAALALSADSAALTAIANEGDYSRVFAKQIEALGRPGDVLVAISTSGNAANVLTAIEAAHDQGMLVVALTGHEGGEIANTLQPQDLHVCVPHDSATRIREVHSLTLHCFCDGIDALLIGVD